MFRTLHLMFRDCNRPDSNSEKMAHSGPPEGNHCIVRDARETLELFEIIDLVLKELCYTKLNSDCNPKRHTIGSTKRKVLVLVYFAKSKRKRTNNYGSYNFYIHIIFEETHERDEVN